MNVPGITKSLRRNDNHPAQMKGPLPPIKSGPKMSMGRDATNTIAKPSQKLMSDKAKTPGKANRSRKRRS